MSPDGKMLPPAMSMQAVRAFVANSISACLFARNDWPLCFRPAPAVFKKKAIGSAISTAIRT
jgi:hypothetical protein